MSDLRDPRPPIRRAFGLRPGATVLEAAVLASLISGLLSGLPASSVRGQAGDPAQDGPRVFFQGKTLPALPAHDLLVREPLPLIDSAGNLVGAAWLEGAAERSLEVRYAAWDGAAWGTPERVAPPAPGSQLALTGVLAADGSPALAWSAFDGHDDEILWSRRDGVVWSDPGRLAADNEVPDITPALGALAGSRRGLLAAWSRYQDGQYRVVVARFDGRRWSEPEPAGPPGSLFPSFEPALGPGGRAATVCLLFRTARPRGWRVLELDGTGRPGRSAQVLADTAIRPVVSTDRRGVVFEWPEPQTETLDLPARRSSPWENLP